MCLKEFFLENLPLMKISNSCTRAIIFLPAREVLFPRGMLDKLHAELKSEHCSECLRDRRSTNYSAIYPCCTRLQNYLNYLALRLMVVCQIFALIFWNGIFYIIIVIITFNSSKQTQKTHTQNHKSVLEVIKNNYFSYKSSINFRFTLIDDMYNLLFEDFPNCC